MPLDRFRNFEISRSRAGQPLEIERSGNHVVCLAFDTKRECFSELTAISGSDGDDAEATRVFNERSEFLLNLHHLSWAELLDFGIDENVFFYATACQDGERLDHYLHLWEELPDDLLVWLVREMALAFRALGDAPPIALSEIAMSRARVCVDDQSKLRLRFGSLPLLPKNGVLSPTAFFHSKDAMQAVLEFFEEWGEVSGIWPELVSLARLSSDWDDFLSGLDRLLMETGEPDLLADPNLEPERLFERHFFSNESLEDMLVGQFRITSSRANNPYEWFAEGKDGNDYLIQVLPPARMISTPLLHLPDRPAGPREIEIVKVIRGEDCLLVVEPDYTSLRVLDVTQSEVGIQGEDAKLLLDRVHDAVQSLGRKKQDVSDFHPENVVLCFDEQGMVIDTLAISEQRPITTWPPFAVKIRTHRTMSSLMLSPELSPASMQRDLVTRYLSLRRQGMHDRAAALLQQKNTAEPRGTQKGKPKVKFEPVTKKSKSGNFLRGKRSRQSPLADFFDPDKQTEIFESDPFATLEADEADEKSMEQEWEDDFDWENSVVLSPIAAAMGIQLDPEDEAVNQYLANEDGAPRRNRDFPVGLEPLAEPFDNEDDDSIFSHLTRSKKKGNGEIWLYFLAFLIGGSVAALLIWKGL